MSRTYKYPRESLGKAAAGKRKITRDEPADFRMKERLKYLKEQKDKQRKNRRFKVSLLLRGLRGNGKG